MLEDIPEELLYYIINILTIDIQYAESIRYRLVDKTFNRIIKHIYGIDDIKRIICNKRHKRTLDAILLQSACSNVEKLLVEYNSMHMSTLIMSTSQSDIFIEDPFDRIRMHINIKEKYHVFSINSITMNICDIPSSVGFHLNALKQLLLRIKREFSAYV